MKKVSYVYVSVTLFFLVFFISGCSDNMSSSDGTSVRRGTQGIEMSFVQNSPPNQIYYDGDGDVSFEAIIELKNKGTFPKDGSNQPLKGKLYISGFDKSVIDGSWDGGSALPVDLTGKSSVFPQGGYDLMNYRDSSIDFPFDADNYEPTIRVKACYNYETTASPLVCIDPSPTSNNQKVCNIQDTGMSGGQGAPVGITKIEQSGTSKKSIFKIHIANLGTGNVIEYDKYNRCDELAFDEKKKVEVSVSLPSLGAAKCTPEGTPDDPVRLMEDGTGFIVCSFQNKGGEAYTTPLDINLRYGYSDSIKKNVNIIRMEN